MEKTTFKQKTKNILEIERIKNLKELGYFTALNKLEDLLDSEDEMSSIRQKINSLRFGKSPF